MIPFVKMHGCGNDFVVLRTSDLESVPLPPAELARRVCDRHFGIGADGLLAHAPVRSTGASRVRMQYWNADGSRAEMCGNGARCVVRDAVERDGATTPLILATDAGEHTAEYRIEPDGRVCVALSMGKPAWQPSEVPASLPAGPPPDGAVLDELLEVGGAMLPVSVVSMGNPHAVVFVPDRDALEQVALADVGRALAEHVTFPAGANASFVAMENGALHVRVWERGAGPTLACGTASCAALAVAVRSGRLAARHTTVHLPGGAVEVWQEDCGTLWLAGPAVTIAAGNLSAELLAPGI